MKFTQNEAAKKISAILTRGGKKCYLSDRTIAEQLDTLMKLLVNDETNLDDFIAQVEPMFKTSNGNAQNDQATFIAQWNTDHPAPEPPTEPKPKTPTNTPSSEYEELRREIQALKDEQAASLKKNALTAKKNELIAKLQEKGVKDKEWINSFVGEISISEDLDVEKKADDYVKLYNKTTTPSNPTPTPIAPKSGDDTANNPLKIASEMARKRREQETIK